MPRFAIAPLGFTTEGSTKYKLKGWKGYLKKLQCCAFFVGTSFGRECVRHTCRLSARRDVGVNKGTIKVGVWSQSCRAHACARWGQARCTGCGAGLAAWLLIQGSKWEHGPSLAPYCFPANDEPAVGTLPQHRITKGLILIGNKFIKACLRLWRPATRIGGWFIGSTCLKCRQIRAGKLNKCLT